MPKGYKGTVEERFFRKVVRKNDDECWTWVAGRTTDNYGSFWMGKAVGKALKAHKAAYLLFKGKVPNDLCVLHSCDNPPCVNPNHVRLGTQQENIRERDEKGRNSKFNLNLTTKKKVYA